MRPQKRGFAVRFLLPGDESTDVVVHSYDGFPTRTPEDFVAFLRALAEAGAAVARFRAAHPEAAPFLDAPEYAPVSYATRRTSACTPFAMSRAMARPRTAVPASRR